MSKYLAILLIQLVFVINQIYTESNADIINSKVERNVDLATHLAKIITVITVENKASTPLNSYTFIIEPAHAQNVAYIGAQLGDANKNDDSDDVNVLQITQTQQNAKGVFYKIDFKKPISSGKSEIFSVEYVLKDTIKPYPTEIQQNDKQLVLFNANAYYYTQYSTKTQVTKVTLASDKVEAYTQPKPTSKSDQLITYGPYPDAKAFEQSEISIHYENNTPFLKISNMLRVIEISHWGNIAVEETIDLYHSGAKLKGPFSRFDFMRRQGGVSAVKALKTVLPPSANSVYYRDEIGNISTSNLRESTQQVELELRPRFPLFGGWKTHYTVGYNIPSYQYLFTKGSNYLLKMKLIDHVYDDQLIDHLTVKIILPEHSKNLDLVTPYAVQRGTNELHYTYLDTVGRPVVVIHKDNVVENHIQDFELRYTFQKAMLLQEPFLVVGAFYLLFTLVILIVRFDFSITKDSAKEATLKAQSYLEQVGKYQDKRESLYQSYLDLIELYKGNKDTKATNEKRKKIDGDLKQVQTDLEALAAKLKAESPEIVEKIAKLNDCDKQLLENTQKQFELAQKLISNSTTKEEYLKSRQSLQEKSKEITAKIVNLVQ